MKIPKILFFDFVETVADVSSVPKAALADYATKAHAIANRQKAFEPFYFGCEWCGCTIPTDRVDALALIRKLARICVLTNAPLPFIVDTSSRSRVSWDAVLCGEMFRQCKPNWSVYRGAMKLMQVSPADSMMVASHNFDVEAARNMGMQSWLIGDPITGADGKWEELARRLAAGGWGHLV